MEGIIGKDKNQIGRKRGAGHITSEENGKETAPPRLAHPLAWELGPVTARVVRAWVRGRRRRQAAAHRGGMCGWEFESLELTGGAAD
jgi:hypothetical protein